MDMQKALEKAKRRYPTGTLFWPAHLSAKNEEQISRVQNSDNFEIDGSYIVERECPGGHTRYNDHGGKHIVVSSDNWADLYVPETGLPKGSWFVSLVDQPACIGPIKKYQLHQVTDLDRVIVGHTDYHLSPALSPNRIRWFDTEESAKLFLKGVREVMAPNDVEPQKLMRNGKPIIKLEVGKWYKNPQHSSMDYGRVSKVDVCQVSGDYYYNSVVFDAIVKNGEFRFGEYSQGSSFLDAEMEPMPNGIRDIVCRVANASDVRVGDTILITKQSNNWNVAGMDLYNGLITTVRKVMPRSSGVNVIFDEYSGSDFVYCSRNDHFMVILRGRDESSTPINPYTGDQLPPPPPEVIISDVKGPAVKSIRVEEDPVKEDVTKEDPNIPNYLRKIVIKREYVKSVVIPTSISV